MNSIAIFILTHARANEQRTLETLKAMGCSKDIVLVVDDMDQQLDEYKAKYGNVEVFSKETIKLDTMTNAQAWGSVVYARNYAYELAKKKKLTHFVMMDDDITKFTIRAEKNGKLAAFDVKDIDSILDAMAEYMEEAPVGLLGFVQNGAYFGGVSGSYQDKIKRDISQVFMCKTDRHIQFNGIMNEDFHASIECWKSGLVCAAIYPISITAPERMANKGGLHDLYEKTGTYTRDFYTIMAYPTVGVIDGGMKLRKSASSIYPKILSEKYKK